MDIGLRPIFDPNIAQPERHFALIQQQSPGISPSIHNIDLGDTSQGAFSQLIDSHRHVQNLIIGDVLVGGHHAEDYAAGVPHVSAYHLLRYFVYVFVLALEGYASKAWQIDYCQVRTAV